MHGEGDRSAEDCVHRAMGDDCAFRQACEREQEHNIRRQTHREGNVVDVNQQVARSGKDHDEDSQDPGIWAERGGNQRCEGGARQGAQDASQPALKDRSRLTCNPSFGTFPPERRLARL
jgi:hypothetical protein